MHAPEATKGMARRRLKLRGRQRDAPAEPLGERAGDNVELLATCDVPNQILKLYLDGAQVGSYPYQLTRIPTNYYSVMLPTAIGDGTAEAYFDELRISNAVRVPAPPSGSVIVVR